MSKTGMNPSMRVRSVYYR